MGSISVGRRPETKETTGRLSTRTTSTIFFALARTWESRREDGRREGKKYNLCFFFVNLQPHRRGDNVGSGRSVAETAAMRSCRRCEVTATLVTFTTKQLRKRPAHLGRVTPTPPVRTTLDSEVFLSFLFLTLFEKRNRVNVCLCVRLHFKVLLCLHT